MSSQQPLPDSPDFDLARVESIKEDERRGRDAGAHDFLDKLAASRGAFRMAAEMAAGMSFIEPRAGQVVLDAGSGVGRHALAVAPRVRRLVCHDLSPVALAVLAEQAARHGFTNVETHAGDVCRLPAELGPFDTVYSVELIQHVPSAVERHAALVRFHDVLAPGGRCVVILRRWNPRRDGAQEGRWGEGMYRYFYRPEELGDALRAAGFADVRVHGFLVLPGRVARHLPAALAPVESWLARMPGSARLGKMTAAIGTRPRA